MTNKLYNSSLHWVVCGLTGNADQVLPLRAMHLLITQDRAATAEAVRIGDDGASRCVLDPFEMTELSTILVAARDSTARLVEGNDTGDECKAMQITGTVNGMPISIYFDFFSPGERWNVAGQHLIDWLRRVTQRLVAAK
jgi:hypothetical protein